MAKTHHHLTTDVTQGHPAAFYLEVVQFQEDFPGDCLMIQHTINIDMSYVDLIAKLRSLTPNQTYKLRSNESNNYIFRSQDVLMLIQGFTPNNAISTADPWASGNRQATIIAYGKAEPLRAILRFLQSVPTLDARTVNWNYMVRGQRMEMQVFIEEPQPTPDEFYPYIEGGVEAYYQRYIDSNAAILLLRGEPGTGKTSFIRNLVWKTRLNTIITYEQQLYETDEMFVHFMTHTHYNLLVMEDADQMLVSRESEGNRIMAKFLNVADGLIRLPQKKIIISSNVMEERKIDSAMLRPGRCFDRPFFRKLTGREAARAAEVAGRPFHGSLNEEYTLAEVLNPPARERESKVVGFVGGGTRATVTG